MRNKLQIAREKADDAIHGPLVLQFAEDGHVPGGTQLPLEHLLFRFNLLRELLGSGVKMVAIDKEGIRRLLERGNWSTGDRASLSYFIPLIARCEKERITRALKGHKVIF